MEQDRIHIKLARRTPEERQADETRRLDPFMRALKAIHTAATPETMNVEDLEKQRKGQELLGRLVAPMAGMSWEPFELDGMNCAWVRPHRGHDRRRAILYCHGGGYTSGNLGYSRILASKLANVTGWQVLSFEYRLAPEHPYPAAVEDAVKAWDYLMYQGYGARDVVVAGDSAGGNLALVLTHLLKEAGRRLPRALILLSPWTDMTASGKSYQERAAIDPVLTVNYIHAVRDAYARDQDRLPALPPVRRFEGLSPHPHPGGKQRAAAFRLYPPAGPAGAGRGALPAGGVDGSLACIPDVPHEKGHRGHGEHRAFPFGDTIKETRFLLWQF